MRRRSLLSLAATALVMPVQLAFASGLEVVHYSPEVYRDALASGEPLLLDFYSLA